MAQQLTVLVTGGSSGIGRATAICFAQKGWRVFEMSRHEVPAEGVTHLTGDVTSLADCQRVVASVLEQAGQLDVLICNAGMGISGSVEFAPDDLMHKQLEVNFFGAVHIIQSVLPHMRRRRQGRILVVSSMAALFGIPFQSFYSASKSALCSMTLALRNEVAPWNISVGCLLPGDVKTGFTEARVKYPEGEEVYARLDKAVSTMEHDEQTGQSAERLARRLYKLATRRRLSAYNYEGMNYRFFALLYKLLPTSCLNWIVGKMY
jgi:NAD(P)-dependent dehydrogenase (short-subunit alcohol dehydrogenase family)